MVLPELTGKLDGIAIRVPTANVSCLDLVATLATATTAAEINAAFKAAAGGPLKGILAVSEEPLVSADFCGDPHSSIVDAMSTLVLPAAGGRFVKVLAWYDNETGFAQRMVDLAKYVGERWS